MGVPATPPTDSALAAATRYCDRGWAPLPVHYREKRPVPNAWQTLRLKHADLPAHFNGQAMNVGILLGAPSDGLFDVDLDCPEAARIADRFLPKTRAVFGRPSKPGSHRIYTCTPPDARTAQFKDLDGAMLVELRGTGGQTVVPPSMHTSGEPITWDGEPEPAHAEYESLRVAVARLAAATLLARHWPAVGSRHNSALALAGGLQRAGWSEQETTDFLAAIAHGAGDEELQDRIRTSASTAIRLAQNGPAVGWPRLGEIVGKNVVTRVRKWLGIRARGTKTGTQATDGGEHTTDLGNAARFAAQWHDKVRFCHETGKWLVWDGKRWVADRTAEVRRLARRTVKGIYKEAAKAQAGEHAGDLGSVNK